MTSLDFNPSLHYVRATSNLLFVYLKTDYIKNMKPSIDSFPILVRLEINSLVKIFPLFVIPLTFLYKT